MSKWFDGLTDDDIATHMALNVQFATTAEMHTYLRAFRDGIKLAGASDARIEAIERAFRNKVGI